MDKTLEQLAREVVVTWSAWARAEGWDNPELDPFLDALHALAEHLGIDME
jgi:hypothetical protein